MKLLLEFGNKSFVFFDLGSLSLDFSELDRLLNELFLLDHWRLDFFGLFDCFSLFAFLYFLRSLS